ncbi:unnamed protein product [Meganyctiphanes norvegica]|uniref:WAP domain-containing protein n=1 Tax=Meganyctiphanes norvegica TaxID=48144 RepID=A0AAV2R2V3_MEGNR
MRATTLLFFTLAVYLGICCGSAVPSKKFGINKAAAVVEEEDSPQERSATKPKSLIGWLRAPTERPAIKVESRESLAAPKKPKPGFCGSPKNYGIKCMQRLDQCKEDHQCPGDSKCCMIGICGYLCVKPKATEELTKEEVKVDLKKKDKKGAATTTEAYDDNNESLKASDVIDMKDMKDMKDVIVEEKSGQKKDTKSKKGTDKDI